MPSIRPINLSSVMPDLDDLPVNRDLLTAFMAANGLLATITNFADADDIRAQTAGLVSTPDEVKDGLQGTWPGSLSGPLSCGPNSPIY